MDRREGGVESNNNGNSNSSNGEANTRKGNVPCSPRLRLAGSTSFQHKNLPRK